MPRYGRGQSKTGAYKLFAPSVLLDPPLDYERTLSQSLVDFSPYRRSSRIFKPRSRLRPAFILDNDFFANRIIVSSPITFFQDTGATVSRTTEVGEDLHTSPFFFTVDRTCWWEYQTDVRRLVNITLFDISPGGTVPLGFLLRGTAVNATDRYGLNQPHFGLDSGTGAEQTTDPVYFSPTQSRKIQVDPTVPLVIQIGRATFFSSADHVYQLGIEELVAPENDDANTATSLTDVDNVFTSGTAPFDFSNATCLPGWTQAQLDVIGQHVSADLFFKVIVNEDATLAARPVAPTPDDSIQDVAVAIYRDVGGTPDTFQLVSNVQYGPGVAQVNQPYAVASLSALETYYVVVFQTYSTSTFTERRSGSIEWLTASAPINDNFADAIDLGSSESGSTPYASTLGATLEPDEPSSGVTASIWWKFTAPFSAWFNFYVEQVAGSNFEDLVAYTADGSPLITLFERANNSNFQSFGPDRSFVLPLRGGDSFYLQLGASNPYDDVRLYWGIFRSDFTPGELASPVEVTLVPRLARPPRIQQQSGFSASS